jgi:menaquinone-dependent protoporphyrinogen oxidase
MDARLGSLIGQEDCVMTKVLVVYGSRHGGTRGIAERIGETLSDEGLDARVAPADETVDTKEFDAFVIGSGVYMGNWLNEPIAFIRRNQDALIGKPVWFFSSGPLRGSTLEASGEDPLVNALGPTEGPGSGGHKTIIELTDLVGPRDHRIFFGMFDPKDPPKAISERLVRMMPAAKGVLPPGDFRDWEDVAAWAREIGAALMPTPIGG